MRNIVGQRVREARIKNETRLTQSALASKLQLLGWDIDRVGIAKIEGGFREVKDREVLLLAQALNTTASWLLGEQK